MASISLTHLDTSAIKIVARLAARTSFSDPLQLPKIALTQVPVTIYIHW